MHVKVISLQLTGAELATSSMTGYLLARHMDQTGLDRSELSRRERSEYIFLLTVLVACFLAAASA